MTCLWEAYREGTLLVAIYCGLQQYLLIQQATRVIEASRGLVAGLNAEERVLMARSVSIAQERLREVESIERNSLLIVGARARLEAIAEEEEEDVIILN